MFREPPFRDFSPFLKILALIAIMIVTFLMVLALGVAISIPFFGKGILSEIAAVTDYQDERIMAALKYFQIVNQIGLFILPLDSWPGIWLTVATWIMWLAVVLTVLTGVDYVISAFRDSRARLAT